MTGSNYWRVLGRLYGVVAWIRRERITSYELAVGTFIAAIMLEVGREVREISDEMEEKTLGKRRKRWLRLQVTTSPLKQANLRLPTTYPFERRAQAWPPFLGVRKELGESA